MEKKDWEFVKHRLRSILHYTRQDEWEFSEGDTDFVATKVASESEGKSKDGDGDEDKKGTRLAVRVKASWKKEQKEEGVTTEQVYEHRSYSEEDGWSTESSYTKNLYKETLKGKAVANFRYCIRDAERDIEYKNVWLTRLENKSETELTDRVPEWASDRDTEKEKGG